MSDKPEAEEERLPVSQERLSVHKRKVETGRVRIRAVPEQKQEHVRDTVTHEQVLVERVPIGREVDTVPQARQEGDTWIFPVVEQVLVVETRSILKEEVRVRSVRRTETVDEPVMVTSTRVIVERGEHTEDETPEYKLKETTMANRTLTALFDSRADAERAQQQLIGIGIPKDSIHLMYQTTVPAGTSSQSETSAAPTGFWEKVKNLFLAEEDRQVYQEGLRRGGTLLAAQVEETQADRAIATLQDCNAIDLDQREAQWRSAGRGEREASAGAVSPTGDGESTSTEEVIPVAEEQLRIGKREIDRGGVRVRSYVVEEPIRENVTLREEHVDVERRPVDGPVTAGTRDDLLQERAVEMRETAEEPVIQKDTRVKEEVVVRKRADERVEEVEDKVRRTQVDVEKGGERMPPPAPGTGRTEPRQPPRH